MPRKSPHRKCSQCSDTVKYCSCCEQHKEIKENFRICPNGSVYAYCNYCVSIRSYKNNKKKAATKTMIKEDVGACAICKVKLSASDLEFAHFDRETKRTRDSGAKVSFSALTVPQMIEELPNGRFICHDCHIAETKEENKKLEPTERTPGAQASYTYKKRKQAVVDKWKLDKGACQDCGKIVTPENVSCFDCDHRPGEMKIASVADLVCNRGFKVVKLELEKCDCVCRPCHNRRGAERGTIGRPRKHALPAEMFV
jgi:hypothetical protein